MGPALENILKELRCRVGPVYQERLVNLCLYDSQTRGNAAPGFDIYVLAVFGGRCHPVRKSPGP